MTRLLDLLSRLVTAQPIATLLVLLAVTLALGAGFTRLAPQAEATVFLPQDSRAATASDKIAALFGDSNDTITATLLFRGNHQGNRILTSISPNPPMRSGLGIGTRVRAVGRDGPRSIPINGAGGGLWLSFGAPMAVLGSGAGAGSAGHHALEDNRGPGRCDSVGRLGSLVDVSGAVGAVSQATAGLAIEPGRE